MITNVHLLVQVLAEGISIADEALKLIIMIDRDEEGELASLLEDIGRELARKFEVLVATL